MNPNNMLALNEVARKMATTELHVLMHIKKGLIQAQEIEGKWYVEPESLKQFEQNAAPDRSSIIQCRKHCGGCSGGQR